MARALFNGIIIAESDNVVEVEGNLYFPPDSLNRDALRASEVTSHCPWKGDASYYDVVVGNDRAEYAAWYYPEPKPAADEIRDHVAFWRDVTVEP